MQRRGRMFAVWVLAVLGACASKEPPPVALEQSPGALLTQYTTYAWRTAPSEGDPRFPTPLSHRAMIIRSSVDRVLARKGYTPSSDHPGFLVDYEVIEKYKQASSFGEFYDYKQAGGSGDFIDSFTLGYSEGVLLIGIFDGTNQRLIWRTRTTVLLNQKDSDGRLREAVGYMLARWPNAGGS